MWKSEEKAEKLSKTDKYRSGASLIPIIGASQQTAVTFRPFPNQPPKIVRAIASGAMVSTTFDQLGFGLSPKYRPTIMALHQTFQLFQNLIQENATPSEVMTSVIRYSIAMAVVPSVTHLFRSKLNVPFHLGLMVLHYARLVHEISIRVELGEFDRNYELKKVIDKTIDRFASCFGNLILWISEFIAEQVTGPIHDAGGELRDKLLSADPKIGEKIKNKASEMPEYWNKNNYDTYAEMERDCKTFGDELERYKKLQTDEKGSWLENPIKDKKALLQQLSNLFALRGSHPRFTR